MIKIGDIFINKSGKLVLKVISLYNSKVRFKVINHPIERYIGYINTLNEKLFLENFKKEDKCLLPDE